MNAASYVDCLRANYLTDFVRAGGASVKFAVADDAAARLDLQRRLQEAALAEGYVVARIDAAAVRVHMIDRVFHEIARQVDWDALAQVYVRRVLVDDLRFKVPEDGAALTLDAVAAANDYDERELVIEFNRQLQRQVFRDYEMTREFRTGMVRLCQAAVLRHDESQADRAAILDWLRGDLRLISALKGSAIHQKIARHNARAMLLSLTHWLTRCGHTGLVLVLDIARCTEQGRSSEGVSYTKAAVMDVYEVLRQLIDGTDELGSCLVLVAAAPGFHTDDEPRGRGLGAYDALRLRIWDDVRDRRRQNPLGALVRLDGLEEVTA